MVEEAGVDDERVANLERRLAELEALFNDMGDGVIDAQAHMMAAEVILVATLAQAKIDRAPIIALFRSMRAKAPPPIATRAEEILLALLEIEAPHTSGFH